MQQQSYNLTLLKNTSNYHEFLIQILRLFEEQSTQNLRLLKTACEHNDMETVYFMAHKLKSGLVLFQIKSAVELINFIETHSKSNTAFDEIYKKIKSLEAIYEKVISEMKSDYKF